MPLYDAVCLFGIAMHKSIQEFGSLKDNIISNGTKMWSYMRHQDFQCQSVLDLLTTSAKNVLLSGSAVPVLTNNVADRLSSYSVYRIRADRELNDNGFLELVMYLDAVKKSKCNDSSDTVWADCFDLVRSFSTFNLHVDRLLTLTGLIRICLLGGNTRCARVRI